METKGGKNKSNLISRDLKIGEMNIARKCEYLSKISIGVIFNKIKWRWMLCREDIDYHLQSL